ncbi:hypothetical protein, partial [Escherichia coli]|uniref:hypothetical protein n=2 Tax=Escherichia coli TaxID=562 RepID=UPI001BDBA7EA
MMDNLKKNLLYFPTRIFSVLTTHNFLFGVKTQNPGLFQQPGFCFFLFTALGAASGYFIPGFTVTATDTTHRVSGQRG